MENSINQNICKKCKLCMEVCPCNVIGINDKNEPYFIPERIPICLECGQCMAVCQSGAISVNGLKYGKDLLELPENNIGYDNYLKLLASRRSVRNFKNQPISEEILNKILYSVSYAPYGAEPNKGNITVINNRQTIESALPHISNFLDNIVKWMENPIASFMIKRKRSEETFNTIKNHLYPIAKLKNYKLEFGDRITRNAPVLIIFHADKKAEEHSHNALIYATYAMLSAHASGLGATMISIVPAAINKVDEVRKIFKIPENHEAVISLIMGYPKFKYKRTIKRNAVKIHWVN